MEELPGATLVVEHGVADLTVIDLDNPRLVLGKVPEVEITLDNPYISRHRTHCGSCSVLEEIKTTASNP